MAMTISVLLFGALLTFALFLYMRQRSDLSVFKKGLAQLEDQLQTHQNHIQEQSFQQYKDQVDLFSRQSSGYQDSINQLHQRLGTLQNSAKQLIDLNATFVESQNFLYSPKLRGVHSEKFLSDLLFQILGKHGFATQYSFADQSKVDAVVFCGDKVLCIDAKFPYENFKKMHEGYDQDVKAKKLFFNDVKKHVLSISAKYVKPEANTFDFALMYCPSENIYYHLVTEFDSGEFEFSKLCYANHVVAVSPNTLYVYLNALQYAIRNANIDDITKELYREVDGLYKDVEHLHSELAKCGSHLHHLMSSFNRVENLSDSVARRTRKVKSSENVFVQNQKDQNTNGMA